MLKKDKACKFWLKNCKIRFFGPGDKPGLFFALLLACLSNFKKNFLPASPCAPLHYLCAAKNHSIIK